jgi:hypothetical protein
MEKYVKGNALILSLSRNSCAVTENNPTKNHNYNSWSIIFNEKPPEYQEELLPALPPTSMGINYRPVPDTPYTFSQKIPTILFLPPPLPARQPLADQCFLNVEAS